MTELELQEFIGKNERKLGGNVKNKLMSLIVYTTSSVENYRSGKLTKSIDNIVEIISSDEPITVMKDGIVPSHSEHTSNVIKLLKNMTSGGLNVKLNKEGLLLTPSEVSKVRPYLISNMVTNVSKQLRISKEAIEGIYTSIDPQTGMKGSDLLRIAKSKMHQIDAILELSSGQWKDAIDTLDNYIKKLNGLKDELNTEL